MRLFVAVVPADAVLGQLDAAVAGLRDGSPPELRWVPRERWHLTLSFLGEVPEDRVDRLAAALRTELAGRPAPALRLAGGGAFGRRVLWAGVEGDVELLGRAARACTRTARAVGVAVERQPFRAHLTLARTRSGAADPSALTTAAAGLSAFESRAWTAGEALLVRSHLGPRPVHEVLAALPLRAA